MLCIIVTLLFYIVLWAPNLNSKAELGHSIKLTLILILGYSYSATHTQLLILILE